MQNAMGSHCRPGHFRQSYFKLTSGFQSKTPIDPHIPAQGCGDLLEIVRDTKRNWCQSTSKGLLFNVCLQRKSQKRTEEEFLKKARWVVWDLSHILCFELLQSLLWQFIPKNCKWPNHNLHLNLNTTATRRVFVKRFHKQFTAIDRIEGKKKS